MERKLTGNNEVVFHIIIVRFISQHHCQIYL